jgi:hypothetical protein
VGGATASQVCRVRADQEPHSNGGRIGCSTLAAWRRDPATTQYTLADIAYALDTIRLIEGGG